jgi:hypothetical protein
MRIHAVLAMTAIAINQTPLESMRSEHRSMLDPE